MENFNKLMCNVFEVEDIRDDQYLDSFEIWDSLTRLTIIAISETQYGVRLSADEVINSKTIGGLRKLIESKL